MNAGRWVLSRSREDINEIHSKTGGRCRHCGKPLALRAYGRRWHVDHGNPLSRGGSDYLSNLHAACVRCNLQKGDKTTTEYRRYRESLGLPVLRRVPTRRRRRVAAW